jgi:CubicO group peptidase (beta-lactamase class C family)
MKTLKQALAFSLLLTAGSVAGASDIDPGAEALDSELAPRLDALLSETVGAGRLPGVVAGIATADGVTYLAGAGMRDLEARSRMTEDTIIAIASMTKPVTTVAVLQLMERGLVDLDAPVSRYLPELGELQLLQGFDAQTGAILRDAPSAPTVRQLLTHTSGFVYEIWNPAVFRAVQSGALPSLFAGKAGLSVPLAFMPGERWEYGIGIDWAGLLVEHLSGQTLDTYFKEHIFTPLKMVDTSYFAAETQAERTATIYARTPKGLVPTPDPTPMVLGGGGLYSTVSDYLRFLRMLLAGGSLDGQRILQSTTVDDMFRNQIGELRVTPGGSQMPAVSNDFDMGFGAPASWGLGFLRHESATAAGRPAGSVSWAGLYNSYFWIDRERGLCAVVATQILPFYDDDSVALLKAFEAAIYSSAADGD